MDLYILRHAIAEERPKRSHEDDSQRRLTREGARKMCRIASGMREAGLSFDLILTSPYLRAMETAEIVMQEFGIKKVLEATEELAPHGNPRKLIDQLTGRHAKRKSVLLVGHEPYLSNLISLLLSGGTNLEVRLKKGGLCKLTASELQYGRCATLEWLLTPRFLRALA